MPYFMTRVYIKIPLAAHLALDHLRSQSCSFAYDPVYLPIHDGKGSFVAIRVQSLTWGAWRTLGR